MRNVADEVPHSPKDHAGQAYLYMLSSSLAFATMGAISHLAGAHTDWQVVALARTLVAFVLTAALALATGVRLVFFRPATLWMRSIAGSVGVLCWFYSLTHLPISTALTLSNTVPVWVTLLAWPILGQRPTIPVWLAIATGIAGVVLIQQPDLSGDKLAGLLGVGNAVCTSVAMIGLNRLGHVDARAVVTHFSGVSTLFALGFMLLTGSALTPGEMRGGITPLLLVGVGLAGTLGQLAMTRAFALGNASKVSVVSLTQIVFGLAFDLFVWHRSFDLLSILGIFLVIAPSAWLLRHGPAKRNVAVHTTT